MLDENLPTFHFKASDSSASSSVLYFTRNGSDPAAEYVFKRADAATNPASRSKYAAALTDPYNPGVVYGEVLVEPAWQQPTLSAAEVRAQNGAAAAPVPLVPDHFTIQLCNPDQSIAVRMTPSSFTKTESWEFEMPTTTFRLPSSSQLDRQQNGPGVVHDITPKIMFKWKKDGRITKDMTCYMVGKSVGKHKSKEPDITVALFKQARESAVTIYEPNLQRVEVEDRKGLDIVLLLGAEVIRDLWLVPRPDVFNISGAAAAGKRKNSRPSASAPPPGPLSSNPPLAMSGALNAHAPTTNHPAYHSAAAIPSSSTRPPPAPAAATNPAIDAETKRLQAMVEQEKRDQERADRDEAKRLRRMLDAEDKERRRRDADVARETERLRRKYGVEGQDLPARATPALPPRPGPGAGPGPQVTFAPVPHPQQQLGYHSMGPGPPAGQPGWFGPPPPQRPVSAGPSPGGTLASWWRGPGAPSPQQQQGQGRPAKKRSGSGPYGGGNPGASVSGFFGGGGRSAEEERRRVQKKRSVHF